LETGYGPVGGMERYVWELSHELHGMGQHITIICEQCLETPTAGIQVIALGTVRPKPRWLALLRFGARVQTWLKQHKAGFDLIHSHERTAVHHVTTFHAPSTLHYSKFHIDCPGAGSLLS